MNKPPPFTGYDPGKGECASTPKPSYAKPSYEVEVKEVEKIHWFVLLFGLGGLIPRVIKEVYDTVRNAPKGDSRELWSMLLGSVVPVILIAIIVFVFGFNLQIQWICRVISLVCSCWLFVFMIRLNEHGYLRKTLCRGWARHWLPSAFFAAACFVGGVSLAFARPHRGGVEFIKLLFASSGFIIYSGFMFKLAIVAKMKGSK